MENTKRQKLEREGSIEGGERAERYLRVTGNLKDKDGIIETTCYRTVELRVKGSLQKGQMN